MGEGRRRYIPQKVSPAEEFLPKVVILLFVVIIAVPQFRKIIILGAIVAVALLIVFLTLFVFLKYYKKHIKSKTLLTVKSEKRFYVQKSILTEAEKKFHRTLVTAVPEALICPKMRVADVINASAKYGGDFNSISQKHFDWVLCHPVSFEPLIAIELDDSSHSWQSTQHRDAVKNEVAQEAGIPLMRFNWKPTYDTEDVRNKIAVILDQIADAIETKQNTP